MASRTVVDVNNTTWHCQLSPNGAVIECKTAHDKAAVLIPAFPNWLALPDADFAVVILQHRGGTA